jgi:pimeloyl-ACP methyl ester carboxylesterase
MTIPVDAASCGVDATIAATVVAPGPDTPVRRRVVVAAPGGSYTRWYWHPDPGELPGYSFMEHLAARGHVVVAFDHLGTGESSRPAGVEPTVEMLAAAADAAARQAAARAVTGDLVPGLPPLRDPELVGIGHSMGGTVTVVQQAAHGTYGRLVSLGHSVQRPPDEGDDGLGSRVARTMTEIRGETGDAPDAHYVAPNRDALRALFYGDLVAPSVIAADERHATDRPVRVVACSRSGYAGEAAAAISVPLFLAFGSEEVRAQPWRRLEMTAYPSSDDVTSFVLRDAAHCHNFMPSRVELWDRIHAWLAGPDS